GSGGRPRAASQRRGITRVLDCRRKPERSHLMAALLHPLAKLDIPGGGQVVAEGNYAYVGHMRPPHGTSVIDVSDPRRPEIVSQISLPAHTHSHKVRVHGDVMLVNNELFRATTGERPDGFEGGIKIYDTSDKTRPRQIGHYKSLGAH